MKKLLLSFMLIAFILPTSLLLTSCSSTVETNADKYGYFLPYGLNVDWGMSSEDVVNSLELKKSELTELIKNDHTKSISFNKKMYGYDALVTCVFTTKATEKNDKDIGLTEVNIDYAGYNYDLDKVHKEWAENVFYEGTVEENWNVDVDLLAKSDSSGSVERISDQNLKQELISKVDEIFGNNEMSFMRYRLPLSTSNLNYSAGDGLIINFDGSMAAVVNQN